jgi:hypothetical protein
VNSACFHAPEASAGCAQCARDALLLKEEREAIIQMMEDKSKHWDSQLKDAVETLVACIRART